MTVLVNRGVEVALETAIVVDFSSLVNEAEAEAETVRLSSSLHLPQLYQDRPKYLMVHSLDLPQALQFQWWCSNHTQGQISPPLAPMHADIGQMRP